MRDANSSETKLDPASDFVLFRDLVRPRIQLIPWGHLPRAHRRSQANSMPQTETGDVPRSCEYPRC